MYITRVYICMYVLVPIYLVHVQYIAKVLYSTVCTVYGRQVARLVAMEYVEYILWGPVIFERTY